MKLIDVSKWHYRAEEDRVRVSELRESLRVGDRNAPLGELSDADHVEVLLYGRVLQAHEIH